MLPLFLHFRMHDQQRVMWQMDRDLSFGIGPQTVSLLLCPSLTVLVVSGHDLANAEFSGNAETDATDCGSWTQVGQLVRMVADTLGTSFVAVHKSGVWNPSIGGLVFEFFPIWIMTLDAGVNLLIDSSLHFHRDSSHVRRYLSNILQY